MAAAEPERGHGLPVLVFLFAVLKFCRTTLKQIKLRGQYLFELNLALKLCRCSLGQTGSTRLSTGQVGRYLVCATVPKITRLNMRMREISAVFSDVRTPPKTMVSKIDRQI